MVIKSTQNLKSGVMIIFAFPTEDQGTLFQVFIWKKLTKIFDIRKNYFFGFNQSENFSGECRGVGGIFFDDVIGDFASTGSANYEAAFRHQMSCASSICQSYFPIIRRRLETPFTEEEKGSGWFIFDVFDILTFFGNSTSLFWKIVFSGNRLFQK